MIVWGCNSNFSLKNTRIEIIVLWFFFWAPSQEKKRKEFFGSLLLYKTTISTGRTVKCALILKKKMHTPCVFKKVTFWMRWCLHRFDQLVFLRGINLNNTWLVTTHFLDLQCYDNAVWIKSELETCSKEKKISGTRDTDSQIFELFDCACTCSKFDTLFNQTVSQWTSTA